MADGIDLGRQPAHPEYSRPRTTALPELNQPKLLNEALELMTVSLVTAFRNLKTDLQVGASKKNETGPRAEPGKSEVSKQKDKSEPKGEELFSYSRIDKIVKVHTEMVAGKRKEIEEQITLRENEKLKPGTYEVQYQKNPYERANNQPGRAFRIHVPEGVADNAPVIVIMPGTSGNTQKQSDYIAETHMHEVADGKVQVAAGKKQAADDSKKREGYEKEKKVIIVTLLAAQYSIDGKPTDDQSTPLGKAWNHRDSLIPNDLVEAQIKLLGYDDSDYVNAVRKLIPQLTVATNDWRRCGWFAASQSVPFRDSLVFSDPRFAGGIMRNIYSSGGTTPAGDKELGLPIDRKRGEYVAPIRNMPQNGNGERVINFDPMADQDYLPHRGKRRAPVFGVDLADKAAKSAGLFFVDNRRQDPEKQVRSYLGTDGQGYLIIGNERVKIDRYLGSSKEYMVRAFVARNNAADAMKTASNFEPGEGIEKGEELTFQTADDARKAGADINKTVEAARKAQRDIRWVHEIMRHGVKIKVDDYEAAVANHVVFGSRVGSTSSVKFLPGGKYEGISTAEIVLNDVLLQNEILDAEEKKK
jgi:hypothetical protein